MLARIAPQNRQPNVLLFEEEDDEETQQLLQEEEKRLREIKELPPPPSHAINIESDQKEPITKFEETYRNAINNINIYTNSILDINDYQAELYPGVRVWINKYKGQKEFDIAGLLQIEEKFIKPNTAIQKATYDAEVAINKLKIALMKSKNVQCLYDVYGRLLEAKNNIIAENKIKDQKERTEQRKKNNKRKIKRDSDVLDHQAEFVDKMFINAEKDMEKEEAKKKDIPPPSILKSKKTSF